MSTKPGKLFVVATPIGNLDDLSVRARGVLANVALIAAEDTRRSGRLLQHFGIHTPMVSLHDFNERGASGGIVGRLLRGEDVALISDAGTPLISDPGYRLVGAAHEHGIEVIAVPGPSAVTAALSICGLPVNRFAFEGYLPEKTAARRALLATLAAEPRTLVFFETPHRIDAALADLVAAFGAERRATIARELTKQFETVRRATLGDLRHWLRNDAQQRLGEFVIVVEGVETPPVDDTETRRLLGILLGYVGVRDAATIAAGITGLSRRTLYAQALAMKPQTK